MEVSALEGLAPNFDWKLYFTSIDEGQLTNLNVGMPDFFKAMDQVITSSTLPQLKSYLRLHIINGNAPWLSNNFYQAISTSSATSCRVRIRPRRSGNGARV